MPADPDSPAGVLTLETIEGPPLDTFSLAPGQRAVLGRARQSDWCLPDMGVSRQHAALFDRDGDWFVEDLNARSGVLVNTIRIDGGVPMRLHHDDLLGVAVWTFRVVIGEPETPHAPVTLAGPAEPATRDTRSSIFLRLRADGTASRELSWRQFEQRYRPLIVGFARRRGLVADEAEDVLQDVLLGFFRVSGSFEYDPARGSFRGFLMTATLNAIRSRHRRARPGVISDVERFADADAEAARQWAVQWTHDILRLALDAARSEVAEHTWEAFELHGRRGVPDEEAGRQLGLSAESVRQAKSRVARRVREHIERLRREEA